MIDVNTIKLAALLQIKDDLNFFINKKIVATLYAEEGKDKYELEADRKLARELLSQVVQRINNLNQPIKKRGSKHLPLDTTALNEAK